MDKQEIAKIPIIRYKQGKPENVNDAVAVEEPLEISIQYRQGNEMAHKTISITMRTPGHDSALATGFLYTEGILSSPEAIEKCVQTAENSICIYLYPDAKTDLSKIERHFYTSSSCGVCGKSSIESLLTLTKHHHISDELKIGIDILRTLNGKVKDKQDVFESTGGLHASALFDQNGELISLFEDVGRHNALDKLIGASFLNKELPLNAHILFLSGRASFELIQKAAMAGIPVICALGAPSSLAIELAKEFNITLLGFLKDHSFNLYSAPERIV